MSANWEVPKSVPFIPPVAVASRKVPRKRKTSVKVLEVARKVSLTRTNSPVPVEPVDAALHRGPLAVVQPAEPRRPAAKGAAPLAVADLVVGLGDGAAD